jgi:hypothetical protein
LRDDCARARLKSLRARFPGLPAAVVLSLLLSACAINAPTPSSQIAASEGSGINYDEYACPRLKTEMESLVRRRLSLIGAQERRIKSSSFQETVLGVGQGDGAEAAELANVRGDENAVHKAMQAKKCSY